jgi:phosphoglycolate phosphatase-like HAD superfamily hydrolase
LKERRLYLFDIDGTLITTGGAGGAAMRAAFASLWRRADGFDGIEFSGRTDRALLKEAITAAGLDNLPFEDQLKRFKRSYYRKLTQTLPSHAGRVLPGVVPLLQRLKSDDRATVGLGTGNFRYSAGMKMRYYGLDSYFSLGGFGDYVEDRALMIAQGIRAAQRRGRHDTVFVLGDTVHDMVAAKANNVIAVGVCTGPASEDILSKAGADIVCTTLEDAEKLLV